MSPSRSAPGAAQALWWALRKNRPRGAPKTSELLRALPRMVSATASGRYTGCSRGKVALMAAAAGYVLSPVDLLPEAVLGPLGLADDAAVLAWLSGALLSEGQAFLAWEREQQGGAPAGGSGAPSGDRSAAGGAPGAGATAGGAGTGPSWPRRPWNRRPDDDGPPDVVQGDVIT